jgi:high frequency lysogenization protein
MSHSLEERTIALAGVFQAATLVQQIARTGRFHEATLETSLRSLFATDPASTLDVFGGELRDIREGLTALHSVMGKQGKPDDIEVLRYALNLVHLESRLNRKPEMLDIIGERIDQARHTAAHFGYLHGNLVSNLASIYQDTISTFRLRIQVSGDPAILQQEENAARVRAALLAGIRAAVLWRQTGGRRWQLVFSRGRVVDMARKLADQANASVYH